MSCHRQLSVSYIGTGDYAGGDNMSINRDMSRYTIQEEKRVRSPSGGFKPEWVYVSEVDVAVYKIDEP